MSDQPTFVPVDLTELMSEGVLMAANERFFWPLGLALTWHHEGPADAGTASGLHVRQWVFPDGHHEAIGLRPDDAIAVARRRRFAEWAALRLKSMPIGERAPANALLSEAAITPLVE